MSDKSHEEEIAKIDDLIRDLAAGNHSVFKVPAKASRIMAREIMRLREELDRQTNKYLDLSDKMTNYRCPKCDPPSDGQYCRFMLNSDIIVEGIYQDKTKEFEVRDSVGRIADVGDVQWWRRADS